MDIETDIAVNWIANHRSLTSAVFFILAGYLSGSVLYASIFGKLLKGKDIAEESRDQNPGTANAFVYGGFRCGILTLCGDLAKGFIPVYLYRRASIPPDTAGLALVLAAPVIGHIFPLFFRFRGGKGIATSFGCLLGLAPNLVPAAILAFVFIFFSIVLQITSHYHRTILTYLLSLILMAVLCPEKGIAIGFGIIVLTVMIRMLKSNEEKEQFEVRLLWRR